MRSSVTNDRHRLIAFRDIFRHLFCLYDLLDSGQMALPGVFRIPGSGEQVCVLDLMVGYYTLTDHQRKAFDLVCLLDMPYAQATKVVYPESKWGTQISDTVDRAVEKMIRCHDASLLHRRDHGFHRQTYETSLGEMLNPQRQHDVPPRPVAKISDKYEPALVPQRNSGVEKQADDLLKRPTGRGSADRNPGDYLSEYGLLYRQQREVYNTSGFADGSLFSGSFRRAANFEFGRRPQSGPAQEA